MAERTTPITVGAVAVVFGVCCGLPLLLSAGVLSIVAGLGVGSWLLATIGVAGIAVVALRAQRRAKATPREPTTSDRACERLM
jgi:type IV secretory pathway TrbD component